MDKTLFTPVLCKIRKYDAAGNFGKNAGENAGRTVGETVGENARETFGGNFGENGQVLEEVI
jgi:hypothetical protein